MRFIEARAIAFGPFRNRLLGFREGMNIFWGKNEAGKSSWHAAIYAGLCGLRRAVGRSKEKEEFTAAHRPWESDSWQVDLTLELEDGRKVEIHQDLDNLMNCSALDADLGRICTEEITFENTPDGAQWLGLDRHTFPHIACIRQAELLEVVQHAEALQEHLQRAADTMGGDATAAQALAALTTFKKEQVGQDRKNSPRPLRCAIERLEAARESLERARFAHREYLDLLEEVGRCEVELGGARRESRILEAQGALLALSKSREQLERMRELSVRFPGGEPPRVTRDQDLADRLAAALDAGKRKPELPDLSGSTAEQLRQELATLPPMPEGDLEPSQEFRNAEKDYLAARESLHYHLGRRPASAEDVETGGATPGQISEWIRLLSKPEPPLDSVLTEKRQRLSEELNSIGKRGSRWVKAIPGLISAGLGVGMILVDWLWPGLILFASGLGWAAWALLRTDESREAELQADLREVETRLGAQQFRWNEWSQERTQSEEEARQYGLPGDVPTLTLKLEQRKKFLDCQRDLASWSETDKELRQRLDDVAAALSAVLRGKGVAVDPSDPVQACELYRQACRERSQDAHKASRRADLERQLASRMELEEASDRSIKRREESRLALLAVAGECGIESGEEQEIFAGLEAWQQERRSRIEKQEKAREDWAELNELLQERSLETVQEEYSLEAQQAERLAEGLSESELDVTGLTVEALRVRIRDAAESATEAEKALASAQTSVRERQRRLASVSEAEEELEAAGAELERVRELERTLDLTMAFLEKAQERVHRSIAPRLAQSVRRHLGQITDGRYVDVKVDPETLVVKVQEASGAWREATRLSHGTAEQVYLLLRLALAEHLTKPGEVCPLILDDVTVQSDTDRTQAVLETLFELSKVRQVILFSQEDEVRKWAEGKLKSGRDCLVLLEAPAPALKAFG